MSPRQPAWSKAPLTQWHAEIVRALLDVRSLGFDAVKIAGIVAVLDKLMQHPSVERMLRQLLGSNGPAVMPGWSRVSFRHEEWRLPMLVILALDAELRPRQRIERFTDEQRAVLMSLLPTKRRRVAAAGYLLLVTALASVDLATGITKGLYARTVAVRLLFVTVRLYGRPLTNSVITLVEAITERKMSASSIYWLVKRPRSVTPRAKIPRIL
jgi:hypothetical protein